MSERFIQNYCDVCRKKYNRGDPVIVKVPERIYFCFDCIKKHKDVESEGRLTGNYEEGTKIVEEEEPREELKQ